jgi:hypothetical protein
MALPEYAKLKAQTAQRVDAAKEVEDDAIKRRYAAMGNLNSGSYIKQQQIQNDASNQRKEQALGTIDLAEAGEAQRQKEVGEGRTFASTEAQKARDADLSFKDKVFGFEKDSKLRALDLADKQYALEKDAQEFNKAMAAAESGNGNDPGLLGFLGGGGGNPVGNFVSGGGFTGVVAKGIGSVFGGGGGGGSFICTEVVSRGIARQRDVIKLSAIQLRAFWRHPDILLFYYENGQKLIEALNKNNVDWRVAKSAFVERPLFLLEKNVGMSCDFYCELVMSVAKQYKETREFKLRGKMVSRLLLLKNKYFLSILKLHLKKNRRHYGNQRQPQAA